MSISPLYHFAYVSQLNRDMGLQCVSDIVRAARSRNATLSLTGLLIFDGDNFFQYLEGEMQPVFAVIESIKRDPRHRNMCMVSQGERVTSRCFPAWNMAYALTTDETLVLEIAQQYGPALTSELVRRLPELDMEP